MRDIHRHIKKPIFSQRALEKWLKTQGRQLQDANWEIVLDFIQSDGSSRQGIGELRHNHMKQQ